MKLEVRWAELVQRLVPSAGERVRFTGSGTEASRSAAAGARVHRQDQDHRFVGHFHGWHDAVAPGGMSHYDGSIPAGIPASVIDETFYQALIALSLPRCLAKPRRHRRLIVEPSGASGASAVPPGFLAALREATRRHGVVLISTR